MRVIPLAFLGSILAIPAFAGDPVAEKIYGRDPGKDAAYVCFSKTFDEAWLKAHPDQNVARMTVLVAQRPADEVVWQSGNMEIHFRDSKATYQVFASCGSNEGALGCGVDCDGGGYQMSVISKSEIVFKTDGYLRYYDAADQATGAKTEGFTEGDKNLTLERSDLRDCLPLADDEVKARIESGALTQ